MFFMSAEGDYCYQPSKIKAAHAWCESQAEYHLFHGRDLVVSNTFVQHWELQAYKDLARRYDADLKVLVCNGNYGNLHGVDEATLARMKSRWQD